SPEPPASSSDPDLRLGRHPGAQTLHLRLTRLELDADGNALDHLHVVAGGVLRRQQAVARPGRAREALDDAVVVAVDRVDVDARLLPPLHPLDLRLAEVRRHPELAV